jgi:hypothetical protein
MSFSGGDGGGGGTSRASQLLLLVPGAIAAGLGAWQLQRREWKVEQLAERTRQLAADPVPMAALTAPGAPPLGEWRRVACKGELRHDAASYVRAFPVAQRPWLRRLRLTRVHARLAAARQVGPRVRTIGGVTRTGFLLVRTTRVSGPTLGAPLSDTSGRAAAQIEPLVAPDGRSTVLLNRGWVPAEWRVRACVRACVRRPRVHSPLRDLRAERTPAGERPPQLRERRRRRSCEVRKRMPARTPPAACASTLSSSSHPVQRDAVCVCARKHGRRMVLGGRARACGRG